MRGLGQEEESIHSKRGEVSVKTRTALGQKTKSTLSLSEDSSMSKVVEH